MSTGYAKLFASIIHSTIWQEANHVRIVWVTMLAMKDRDGVVSAAVPGLAGAARVTLEECEEALAKFTAPDKYSRIQEHEGRRIEKVVGGWRLLNSDHYRDLMSADEQKEKAAARSKRHWDSLSPEQKKAKNSKRSAKNLTPSHDALTRPDESSTYRSESDQIRSEDPPLSPDGGGRKKRGARARGEKTPVDPKLAAGPEARALAQKGGLDLPQALAEFVAHARGEGWLKADWQAALCEWLLRAPRMTPRSAVRAARPEDPDERRRVRNNLFSDAKDGFYGRAVQARAIAAARARGADASTLVDELERGEHQRASLRLALPPTRLAADG